MKIKNDNYIKGGQVSFKNEIITFTDGIGEVTEENYEALLTIKGFSAVEPVVIPNNELNDNKVIEEEPEEKTDVEDAVEKEEVEEKEDAEEIDLEAMNYAALVKHAKATGVEVPRGAKKQDIIDLLTK